MSGTPAISVALVPSPQLWDNLFKQHLTSMEEAEKFYYSWDQFKKDALALADVVLCSGMTFDVVLAITRGGLIPAYFIAKKLGTYRVLTLGVEHYADNHLPLERPYLRLPLPDNLDEGLGLKGAKVLIVDEVIDTGKTAQLAVEEVEKYTARENIAFATIHIKPGKLVVPLPEGVKFFWLKETNAWIVHPWEIES